MVGDMRSQGISNTSILLRVDQNIYFSIRSVKTLRPRQDGRHFTDDNFKSIFLNENVFIWFKFSLKFVPKVRMNNIPALVQLMACCRSGDKPLSEPVMVSLLTHIFVTRPQWVKEIPLYSLSLTFPCLTQRFTCYIFLSVAGSAIWCTYVPWQTVYKHTARMSHARSYCGYTDKLSRRTQKLWWPTLSSLGCWQRNVWVRNCLGCSLVVGWRNTCL